MIDSQDPGTRVRHGSTPEQSSLEQSTPEQSTPEQSSPEQSSPEQVPRDGPPPDEPPPFLGRWANLYALVIVVLIAIIVALSWLTRRFS